MDYSKAHKAHPWHGISPGNNVPEEVRAFIEIVPTDTVKYEVDKESGYLSLDRPQKFSNIVPSLYGFLPRTYCGPKMAALTNKALVRTDVEGDGDPLDICILTEKDVPKEIGDVIGYTTGERLDHFIHDIVMNSMDKDDIIMYFYCFIFA
mgnify:CR=1 FL=1